MRYLAILLVATVLVSGCAAAPPTVGPATLTEQARDGCIAACQDAMTEGRDLSNGPCLSNEIAPGWVCDVAHSPREPVDNLPENQCSAWREAYQRGEILHFVEVDPDCNFIRAV